MVIADLHTVERDPAYLLLKSHTRAHTLYSISEIPIGGHPGKQINKHQQQQQQAKTSVDIRRLCQPQQEGIEFTRKLQK